MREFASPVVALGGVPGEKSYHGVLVEVLDDAYVLERCQVSEERVVSTPSGPQTTLDWTAAQGAVIVDRGKVAFVQLLDGLPYPRGAR